MTITTTTPPPARGGVRKRPACRECGNGFVPRNASQIYCDDECAYGAALRKQRGRNRQRDTTAGPVPVFVSQRPPVVRRAATLAETPDVPAATADRGEQLTGGAAATMQCNSGVKGLG